MVDDAPAIGGPALRAFRQARRMNIEDDRALNGQRQARLQAECGYAMMLHMHVGDVAPKPRRLPAFGVKQVERCIERSDGLSRRGEPVTAGADAHRVTVQIRKVQRPAPCTTGSLQQTIHPCDADREARQAFQALV